ncbi:MAG: enoyl-CoA hydratase/isomerase family protein [Bordetella sp.]|nr:enoyl-CoA hydratase/isomerase family protein [Bordetella sp.]
MSVFEFLEIQVLDSVRIISLNRPAQRNALNRALCIELLEALRLAEADSTVAAVVLRANGSVFCAGADLAERKAMDAEQVRERRLLAFDCYDALEALAKPCIAMVEGPAIGAGVELATACDFVWATESASFRYPEVAWGTVGATQRLPEIVGKRMAKELLFTGRTVDGQEALRLGLVNRIVPANSLAQAQGELLEQLLKAPVDALRLAKRCVNARFDDGRRAALTVEIAAIDELLAGPTWKARIETFGASSRAP